MMKSIFKMVLGSMIISSAAFAQGSGSASAGFRPFKFKIKDVTSRNEVKPENGGSLGNEILTGVILAILGNIKAASVDFGLDGTITHQEVSGQSKIEIALTSLFFDSKISMNKDMLISLATKSTDRNLAKMLPSIAVNTENMLVTGSLDLAKVSDQLRVEFCKPSQMDSSCNDTKRSPLHIHVGNKIFKNIIGLGFRSISANLRMSEDGTTLHFNGGCEAYKTLTDLTTGDASNRPVTCSFDGFASFDNKIGQKIHLVYK